MVDSADTNAAIWKSDATVADWVAGGYLAEAGGQPEGIAATQKPDMEKEVS